MSPSSSHAVSLTALRGLLRLVSDLKDLPDGSLEQRRLALEGLSRILGVKVALWVNIPRVEDGVPVLECPIDMGWASASERALFRYHVEHPRDPPDPAHPSLVRAMGSPQATVLRNDVVADREWYGSDHVQDIRRGACVDSFLIGFRHSPGRGVSTISLHRPWGDRPFTEDDRAILEVFRQETPWLDTPPNPLHDTALSPRLAAVLRGLTRGLSEKEVAAELDMSPHTTHDHVKALYRRFGVRSRGELLARTLGPPPAASGGQRGIAKPGAD